LVSPLKEKPTDLKSADPLLLWEVISMKSKRGDVKLVGALLFFGALLVFAIYMFTTYIPAMSADMTDSEVVMNAVWWGLGCGIVGTIGAFLAKSN
jgi:hypothetical protein